jgi:SagB-type dehydrogenase family enzyme
MSLANFFAGELPVLSEIVTFCNNLPISLYADSTGVKSPEVAYRGLLFSHNSLVSLDYLLNFRRSDADLGVVVGASNYSLPMAVGAVANRDLEEVEDDFVTLPPYENVKVAIGSVIRSRRSVRRYSGKTLSLVELSTLLFHAAGVSGSLHVQGVPETATLGKSDHVDLRTVASGGALYPIDLYVFALNVADLPTGAYRYLPKCHALKPVPPPARMPALRELAQFGEIEVEKAALLVGYVYNLFENARKYGDVGLALAFLEAGSISGNVHLLSTALGIGSCDVGSFAKGRWERLLEADGLSRHMIHLTVVGK